MMPLAPFNVTKFGSGQEIASAGYRQRVRTLNDE